MAEHALSVACGNIAAIWRPEARDNSFLQIQHHDECRAVAWNHNNKVLASGGTIGRLALHYHNAGLMGVLPREEAASMSPINDLTFSRGSKLIATAHDSAEVHVWDLKNQVIKHVITEHSDAVSCVSFSPHDLFLASGSIDGALFLHDAHSWNSPVCLAEPESARVNSLHSSAADAVIASANEDGQVQVWDASQQARVWSRALHRGAATGARFSPMTASILLTAGTDGHAFIVDRRDRGDQVTEMLPGAPLTALSCREDGSTIAFGTLQGDVILYDPRQLNQALARKRCSRPGETDPVTALNWTNGASKPKRLQAAASSASTSQSSVAPPVVHTPSSALPPPVAQATPDAAASRTAAGDGHTEPAGHTSRTNGHASSTTGLQNGHAAAPANQPEQITAPPRHEAEPPTAQEASAPSRSVQQQQQHLLPTEDSELAEESALAEDGALAEELMEEISSQQLTASRPAGRGGAAEAGPAASSSRMSGGFNLDAPMDEATERFHLLHETMRRMHLEMIRQFSILQVDVADSIEALAQQQNSLLHQQAAMLQQQSAMGQQLASLQAKWQDLSQQQPPQQPQHGKASSHKSSWNL